MFTAIFNRSLLFVRYDCDIFSKKLKPIKKWHPAVNITITSTSVRLYSPLLT